MLLTTYVLIMLIQSGGGSSGPSSIATQRISTFSGEAACEDAARGATTVVPLPSTQVGFVCVPWNAVNLPRK